MFYKTQAAQTEPNEFKLFQTKAKQQYISTFDKNVSNCFNNIVLPEKDETPVTYHFQNTGRFALHDIAEHFVKKTGLAHCVLSSFNLSQPAARLFLKCCDKHLFLSLNLILNKQKRNCFKKAINIIDNIIPIHYSAIHAKVCLLWNDQYNVVIGYTGNLSNNKNIECGFLSTDPELFNFHKQWLSELIN